MGKGMRFHAPQAKRMLAACLLGLPLEQRAPPPSQQGAASTRLLTVSVEACGSGKVLVRALQVDRDLTIGALKACVVERCVPSGGVRLFLGHAGEELAVDSRSLLASGVVDRATLVVVRLESRDALMRLFEDTGGSSRWKSKAGWGSAAPLSEWNGVTCGEGGCVIRLEWLFGNGLQGARREGLLVAIGKRVYH